MKQRRIVRGTVINFIQELHKASKQSIAIDNWDGSVYCCDEYWEDDNFIIWRSNCSERRDFKFCVTFVCTNCWMEERNELRIEITSNKTAIPKVECIDSDSKNFQVKDVEIGELLAYLSANKED